MALGFLSAMDGESEHAEGNIVAATPSPSKPVITNGCNTATTANLSTFDLDTTISHLSSHYSNPSLFVTPSHSLTLSPTPIPFPSPTQALIHIRCTGICGSDLHLWHRGAIGPLVVTQPCILGHEASGVVVAVGSAVAPNALKAGDRVAIEPGVPCQTCWLCRAGKYNLCEKVEFAGVCPISGSVRRFMCHEARYCHRMPDKMSFRQGALCEPLAVVMHAIRELRGSVALGRPVLMCGAGPIGLIALMACRASGSWPLVITDLDEGRLEIARRAVPGVRTWKVDGIKSPMQNAEGIRRLFRYSAMKDMLSGVPDEDEYMAPSVVLECTGVESSVVTAAYACRRGGTVMVVGVGRDKIDNLPFMHLSLAEIELRFINRYRDMWPAAMNVLAEGRVIDLDMLVTHNFELESAIKAMETCADRAKGAVKVHIVDDMDIRV